MFTILLVDCPNGIRVLPQISDNKICPNTRVDWELSVGMF